jgi:hypothetical protein
VACDLAVKVHAGYGDAVPVTLAGRLTGSMVILSGLLMIAVPITVIGKNFSIAYMEARVALDDVGKGRQITSSGRKRRIVRKHSLIRGVLPS